MTKCLSQWEQALCQKLIRTEIRGKKGRKVLVPLTKQMHNCIDVIVEKRKH